MSVVLCEENDKRLMIIPRCSTTEILKKEKSYYRKIMGIEPEFFEEPGLTIAIRRLILPRSLFRLIQRLGMNPLPEAKRRLFSQSDLFCVACQIRLMAGL